MHLFNLVKVTFFLNLVKVTFFLNLVKVTFLLTGNGASGWTC